MRRQTTMKGVPLHLSGPTLHVGEKAPNVTVRKDLKTDIDLVSDSRGKVRIFSVVPSLDTPVCADMTKRFNNEISHLPNVVIYTISADLPVAQKRFCHAEGITSDRMQTVSDFRDTAFGLAYGTLIPELRIHSRAVFVLDKDDTLKYVEYVPEVANHPNYEAVLSAVRGIA